MIKHYRRTLKAQLRAYQEETGMLPAKIRMTPYEASLLDAVSGQRVMGVPIEIVPYGSSGLAERGEPLA